LAVFSDYAGDSSTYWTFAYYITDFGLYPTLVRALTRVKEKHGIVGPLAYKERKDRRRTAAFDEWFREVRRHPGLMVLVAYDKAPELAPAARTTRSEAKAKLPACGLEIGPDDALRIVRVGSFIPLVCHLLESHDSLFWAMDWDRILDTSARLQTLKGYVKHLVSRTAGHSIAQIELCAPFKDWNCDPITKKRLSQYEDLLSIPDMLAGSMAAVLTRDRKFHFPDSQTRKIVQSFAKLGSPRDVATLVRQCHLCIYVFDQHPNSSDPVLRLNEYLGENNET
jgi:hypothetical protein